MKYLTNADDFGRTQTVNQAITYGFDNGYLSRTTVMVNMPFLQEAIQLSKEYGFFDKVGLHINLVSGEPLTENIKRLHSIVDSNGRFNGGFFQNKRLRFILLPKERKYIYEEIEAQINKYLDSGFTLLHADSHGHVHTFDSLRRIIINVLRRRGFQSLRISLNLNTISKSKLLYKRIINMMIVKNMRLSDDYKYLGSYKDVLRNKGALDQKDGICEIMLHPNIYEGVTQIGEGLRYPDLDAIKEAIIYE